MELINFKIKIQILIAFHLHIGTFKPIKPSLVKGGKDLSKLELPYMKLLAYILYPLVLETIKETS